MSEIKDPRIKLFGKTIELLEAVVTVGDNGAAAVPICVAAAEYCSDQDLDCSSNSVLEDGDCRRDKEEEGSCKSPNYALDETGLQFSTIDDSTGHSSDTDAGSMKPSKAEEDHLETNNSQEKSLKKPDKILPCPRCNSMDTKFCYFNNCNVRQPRHFCKNCQRYWTAGGTMRNVPVGAGRRKNKSAVSLIRQVTIPEAEAIQSARMEISNGIHSKGTTLLTFSSDSPLCESMASALSIVDKTTGLHKHEAVGISVSHGNKENGDDPSCGSSSVAASSKDEASKSGLPPMMPNCQSFVQQVPCYPGTPSLFHWNLVQWQPPGSPPTVSLPSFQMPLYSAPPPYWGCAIPPGSLSVPWIILPTLVASEGHTAQISPTLGKHSRDDSILKQKGEEEEVIKESSSSEKCIWVPKTLRINDPSEAAKSSIWATLGIKNDRDDSVGGRGLFKAFQRQSRGSGKSPPQQTSPVLHANPAAFSRSVSFHEST